MSSRANVQSPATWKSRLSQTGWVLLPLRMFLGITLVYAGLLKFFDASYLDPNSPNGVQAQMLASAATSPISGLVTFSAEHATLFGLSIAFGELIAGLGIVLGVWTRVAALGGLLLSLSFFLTVSWGTDPYFFGPDIVFLFAFTPLVIGGDGGVLSFAAVIARATRRRMRLAVPAPAFESQEIVADVHRRTVLRTGATVAVIGAGALAVGAIGRTVAGNTPTASAPAAGVPAATAAAASGSATPGGVKIADAASVPVGGVFAFTNPSNDEPSFVLQPAAGTYLAYSGVCTHQGCTVGYDQASNEFSCPCHGARFDGTTGDVTRGPAKTPLAKLAVTSSNGSIYLV